MIIKKNTRRVTMYLLVHAYGDGHVYIGGPSDKPPADKASIEVSFDLPIVFWDKVVPPRFEDIEGNVDALVAPTVHIERTEITE